MAASQTLILRVPPIDTGIASRWVSNMWLLQTGRRTLAVVGIVYHKEHLREHNGRKSYQILQSLEKSRKTPLPSFLACYATVLSILIATLEPLCSHYVT